MPSESTATDRVATMVALLAMAPIVCAPSAWAQAPPAVDQDGNASMPTETAGPSAGYASVAVLQIRDDAEISSKIIRLADIITPVGAPPEGWNRAASAAVALLPSDGRRLRIERQRVGESLKRSGLITGTVRFIGPDYVSVRYVPPSLVDVPADLPVSAVTYRPPTEGTGKTSPGLRQGALREDQYPPLLPAERNRIHRLIDAAFRRSHGDVSDEFEMNISATQSGVDALAGLREIRTVRLLSPPAAGPVELDVVGDGETDAIQSIVRLTLEPLPRVIVLRTQLNRGDIVSERDLESKPMPREQFKDNYATDLQFLVGKEMVRSVSAGRPLRIDDVSDPIIIERGDLVELRVVGGGVTVSTNAKALGPAALGEMVMVETDDKSRLMARAVRTGVTEILTRPPTTQRDVHGQ